MSQKGAFNQSSIVKVSPNVILRCVSFPNANSKAELWAEDHWVPPWLGDQCGRVHLFMCQCLRSLLISVGMLNWSQVTDQPCLSCWWQNTAQWHRCARCWHCTLCEEALVYRAKLSDLSGCSRESTLRPLCCGKTSVWKWTGAEQNIFARQLFFQMLSPLNNCVYLSCNKIWVCFPDCSISGRIHHVVRAGKHDSVTQYILTWFDSFSLRGGSVS